jgi:diguanylate cyclase (GGDEF)-like protein
VPLRHDRRRASDDRGADASEIGRVVAWLTLLGFVVVAWPVVPGAFGVQLSGRELTSIGNVVQSALAATATVFMLRGAGRRRGRERAGWTVLAGAVAVWAAANLIWILRGDLIRPGYDLVEVTYIVSHALAIVGFLLLPPAANRSTRVRLLDAAIMMVAAVALLWSMPFHDEVSQVAGSPGVGSVDLFALVEMGLMIVAVGALSRCLPDRRGEVRALVSGVLVLGLADLMWAYSGGTGTGRVARVSDALYTVSMALAVIAGRRLLASASTAPAPERRRSDGVPPPRRLALPELASIVALLGLAAHDSMHDHVAWISLTLGATIVFLTIVRLGYLEVEQRTLTRSLRRSVEQLHTEARTDALTGVGNRLALEEHLRGAVTSSRHDGTPIAVMFVDVDHFKRVNDALGHQVGDGLLVEVTRRLQRSLGPHVFRTGGDELVAVVHGCDDARSQRLAASTVQAVGEPVVVDDHELVVAVSIGVVCSTALPGGDDDELLRAADLALYRAKADGRGCWVAYDRTLQRNADLLRLLARDLEHADERDELEVSYQPVMDLASGATVGATAVLGWNSPRHGQLCADDVATIARDGGLLDRTLRVRFAEVRRVLRELATSEGGPEWVGLHLSAEELVHPALTDLVVPAAAATGDPSRLHVDVDEGAVLDEGAWEVLAGMRQLGVTITVEHFGAGPSSLLRLDHYPASVIRLDGSFVHGMGRRRDDTVVVATVAGLGTELGLELSADGIEEDAQRAALLDLGFRTGRGHHVGEPVPWTELVRGCAAPLAPSIGGGAWSMGGGA